MNLRLIVGIVLFVLGIIAAFVGIAGVGAPEAAEAVVAERSTLERVFGGYGLPIFAGLALAIGGLLIGLSMGNWKNPRTHLEPGDEVVNPEGYHKMKHV